MFGSKSTDPGRVLHKEEKLDRTRQALDQSTAGLYERIDAVERSRYGSGGTNGFAADGSLPAILHTWVCMQHAWAVAVAEQLQRVASLSPGSAFPGIDPPPVYGPTGQRYEALGAHMGYSTAGAGVATTTTRSGAYSPQRAMGEGQGYGQGYGPGQGQGRMGAAMAMPVGAATMGRVTEPEDPFVPQSVDSQPPYGGGPRWSAETEGGFRAAASAPPMSSGQRTNGKPPSPMFTGGQQAQHYAVRGLPSRPN